MSLRVVFAAAASLACGVVGSGPLVAQQRSFEQQVARAVAALDSAETERGVELLRRLVSAIPVDAPATATVRAHLHLAAASVSLGLPDSAAAHFAHVVRMNPFTTPALDAFNPVVQSAYWEARHATAVVGLRTATDTVLRPLADSIVVVLAVGMPAEVIVRLTNIDAAQQSVERAVRVDTIATLRFPLRVSDSLHLEPGAYRLTAHARGTPTDSVSVRLSIARLSVDTAPHERSLDSALFKPERRKGGLAVTSAISGIAIGLVAATIPHVLGREDLDTPYARIAAASVGVGISIAGVAGVFLGRPMVPIEENVRANRALMAAWEQRNRAIAASNLRSLRAAPLRLQIVTP